MAGPVTRILILGGTKDARVLASLCVETWGSGVDVITSLAGRTRSPQTIAGNLRVGGFGGADGLIDYIQTENISILVDATHPFADTISRHAAIAAQETSTPLIMIERPAWVMPDSLQITRVPSLEAAASALSHGDFKSVFVTTGVNGLQVFADLPEIQFLVRQIEDHEGPPPFDHARIIVQKPPFKLDRERQTMVEQNIDVLVTKESGGEATEAKLVAANELGVHVIMIERPPLPDGHKVATPEAVINWIAEL